MDDAIEVSRSTCAFLLFFISFIFTIIEFLAIAYG